MDPRVAGPGIFVVLLVATLGLGLGPANLGNVVDSVDATCGTDAERSHRDDDGDGITNACDDDMDGDGLSNEDEEALGTDPKDPDSDDDGHLDGSDVCPTVANPKQLDADGDGAGAACDPDEVVRAPRATFVWHCDNSRVPCRPAAQELIDFAVDKDLQQVFVQFSNKTLTDPSWYPWYAEVIDGLHAARTAGSPDGIEAHALWGGMKFLKEPGSGEAWLENLIDKSETYELHWDGLFLDVEPWARKKGEPLAYWDGREEAVATQYEHLLQNLTGRAHEVGWRVEALIPTWLDSKEGIAEAAYHERWMAAVDAVALGAFYDDAATIIRTSIDEIRAGERLGVDVRIGVSVKADASPENSFFLHGEKVMERELRKVEMAFADDGGVWGIGVNPYAHQTLMRA